RHGRPDHSGSRSPPRAAPGPGRGADRRRPRGGAARPHAPPRAGAPASLPLRPGSAPAPTSANAGSGRAPSRSRPSSSSAVPAPIMNRPAPSVLDAIHRVGTPASVQFVSALAGVFGRAVAWLLDRLIILAVYLLLAIILGLLMGGLGQRGVVSALLLYCLLDWGYMVLFESLWAGQTPGKRALGLRVLQEGGVRVGFEQVLLRNLARAVDGLPVLYAVGGVATLLSRRHQRLGDLLAGTVVIRERKL